MAGTKNRVVYVSYVGNLASNRLGSMNMTPFLGFGTYGTQTHNQTKHKNYAEHGNVCLGGRKAHANRLGREAVSQFYNALWSSGLSIKLDPSTLLQEMGFEDDDNAEMVKLEPLRYDPYKNESAIRERLNWYAWHASEWDHMYLGITKAQLQKHQQSEAPSLEKDKFSVPLQTSAIVRLKNQIPNAVPQSLSLEENIGKKNLLFLLKSFNNPVNATIEDSVRRPEPSGSSSEPELDGGTASSSKKGRYPTRTENTTTHEDQTNKRTPQKKTTQVRSQTTAKGPIRVHSVLGKRSRGVSETEGEEGEGEEGEGEEGEGEEGEGEEGEGEEGEGEEGEGEEHEVEAILGHECKNNVRKNNLNYCVLEI
jgi:hypothetical protein